MNDDLKTVDVDWCAQIWMMLADGGTWAVPRSGLIFQKIEDELVLTEQMPLMEGMPLSEKELEEYQDADYEVIKEHFAAAGVTVSRR